MSISTALTLSLCLLPSLPFLPSLPLLPPFLSLSLFFLLKSAKAERLENEVLKYRQKAEDAEYLKKRVTVRFPCTHLHVPTHDLSLSLPLLILSSYFSGIEATE